MLCYECNPTVCADCDLPVYENDSDYLCDAHQEPYNDDYYCACGYVPTSVTCDTCNRTFDLYNAKDSYELVGHYHDTDEAEARLEHERSRGETW